MSGVDSYAERLDPTSAALSPTRAGATCRTRAGAKRRVLHRWASRACSSAGASTRGLAAGSFACFDGAAMCVDVDCGGRQPT